MSQARGTALNRRLVVNLTAFAVLSAGLVAYGYVDLVGNPLAPPTQMAAVFPDASGVAANFSVQLNGVDVGSVTGVTLTKDGAKVEMAIDHGVQIPGDVEASIAIANDLGEQVVELTPTRGGKAAPLGPGAVIPTDPGGLPADIGKVVSSATTLLQAIPPGQLNGLLADLATALRGRSSDLRTIISASTTFSQEFLAYQQQFEQLLANAPPVLDAVTAVGPQLRQALVQTETLVQVLATQRFAVDQLLQQGANVSGQLGGLVSSQAANLGCLLHDTADIAANLAQPGNLGALSDALADNDYFFGAVDHVLQPGTAKALRAGEKDDPNQFFLRTRLLLPPAQPSADAYGTPNGLPSTEPGLACSNQLGTGVGPATQPGAAPSGTPAG